jgi:hypothetical protein
MAVRHAAKAVEKPGITWALLNTTCSAGRFVREIPDIENLFEHHVRQLLNIVDS